MFFRFHASGEQAGPALVVLALLAGCSAMRQDIALKADDSVAIVVTKDVGWPGPPAPGRVRMLNQSASSEVRTGAGAGALAGAAVGLLCGPLAPYCVPMAALEGAQVGALGGAIVGNKPLPAETAERLLDRVERVLRSTDVCGVIESDVAERVRVHWNLKAEHATATLEIRLQEFALSYTGDQRVRCSFKVNVAVREIIQQSASGRQPWPGSQPRQYEYVCPYADVAAWLDESQGVVEANFAAGSRYLAAEIVSGLAARK